MRTQLLCALAFLCGAEVAHAQGWGTDAYNNAYGYGQNYTSASTGYDYSGAYANSGYYPNANGYYNANPYYANAYQNYGYGGYGYYPGYTGVTEAPATEGVPSDVPADGAGVGGLYEPPCKCRIWGNAEYAMSWLRTERLNAPLVTVGSSADLHPGAIGQPGTSVAFGGDINQGLFNGVKTEIGYFLDDHQHFGVEVAGQYFGQTPVHFSKMSDVNGNPVIARPFVDASVGGNDAFQDSLPTSFVGGATVDGKSELWSAEINARYFDYCSNHFTFDGLIGFRYVHLAESLNVNDTITAVGSTFDFGGAPVDLGSTLNDVDSFRTNNNFYGMQIGGRVRWDSEWVFVNAYAKVAAGANQETVDINGSSTLHSPTLGTSTLAGGILALPSNIGHYTQTIFAVIPEGGVNVGVKITNNIQVMAGYSFLLWNQVVRPGRQIDGTINPSLVPSDNNYANLNGTGGGAARPVFNFSNETFWAQTLSFGLQLQY